MKCGLAGEGGQRMMLGSGRTADHGVSNQPGILDIRIDKALIVWWCGQMGNGVTFFAQNPSSSSSAPTLQLGLQEIILWSSETLEPRFHFWWNNTTERSLIKEPAFKIDWKIRNAGFYHTMGFVSKDLSGNISTPGLGSLPPLNYYKERHEY